MPCKEDRVRTLYIWILMELAKEGNSVLQNDAFSAAPEEACDGAACLRRRGGQHVGCYTQQVWDTAAQRASPPPLREALVHPVTADLLSEGSTER